MKSKLCSALITVLIFMSHVHAQNIFPSSGSVGIGTTTPNVSSLLEIKSSSKGVLIPRLTLAQRNEIISPATSLLIYQTDGLPGFYYYNGANWLSLIANNRTWLLNGNSGTSSANFIGTTDAQSFTIKVNNQKSGYIDYKAGLANTGFGYQSLDSTTGSNNTALGYQTMNKNTTGFSNVALGTKAMFGNTTGNSSVGVGDSALFNNNAGVYNTAIGTKALYRNTSNVNVAVGYEALYSNNIGDGNTANGFKALYSNTEGESNTAIGIDALYSNTNGLGNTAVGNEALYTMGGEDLNSAFGSEALYYNTTGDVNVAIGAQALFQNSNGHENTAIGIQALYSNTLGDSNTGLGAYTNIQGSASNATAVGFQAIAGDNQVRVGNSDVTSIGGYVGWSNISDERVKKNIKQNVPGLAFINKLQPITYNLDLIAVNKIIQPSQRKDKAGNVMNPLQPQTDAQAAKEKIVYTGFIAQDVEKAAKLLNYDFSGVDAAKNSKDLYALRYAEFVVPLVKAVQELSKQNDSLKTQNLTQQQINTDLQNQINQLKALITSKTAVKGGESLAVTSASLQQNIPNPFSSSTTIGYNLPASYSSANIIVTDAKGVVLKQINLSSKGKGNIQLDASTLATGAYRYSLYVDEKMIDSKQMISSK